MFVFWWFAETTLVASVLALLATIAGRRGRLGPAMRHGLWVVALARLLTPPILSWPAIPADWLVTRESPAIAARAPVDSSFTVHELSALTRTHAALDPTAPTESATSFDLEAAADRSTPAEIGADARSQSLPEWRAAGWTRVAPSLFLTASIGWGALQIVRIVQFSRRLRNAKAAPDWLAQELGVLAKSFGVRPPRLVVSDACESPLLWCWGRSRLVVPASLVPALDIERWRAILAHELAHLRRGDPWVAWAALAAGVGWWWNPLYWCVRRRIEDEAELACDAWVVALLPNQRRVYAETLIDVCESFSRNRVLAPALGVGGRPGRFLERRLTMILRDRVSCRASAGGLVTLACLALLAAPSWTRAQTPPEKLDETSPASQEDRARKREADARLSNAQAEVETLARDLAKLEKDQAQESTDRASESARAEAEKHVKEAEARLREAQIRLKKELAEASERLEKARRNLKLVVAKVKRLDAKGNIEITASEKLAAELRSRAEDAKRRPEQEITELKRAIEMLARKQESNGQSTVQAREELQSVLETLAKKQAELDRSRKTNPLGATAEADAQRASAIKALMDAKVALAQKASSGNLESRMDRLEAKFDALLNELKSLRGELKGARGAN
jgi:beta-lactamase regulating signal transducer with metallopeptidase domain